MSIKVVCLFDFQQVVEMEFPAVPRAGEAVFLPQDGAHHSIFIVKKVGYRFDDTSKAALPIIECSLFHDDAPPPTVFDRMISGG